MDPSSSKQFAAGGANVLGFESTLRTCRAEGAQLGHPWRVRDGAASMEAAGDGGAGVTLTAPTAAGITHFVGTRDSTVILRRVGCGVAGWR